MGDFSFEKNDNLLNKYYSYICLSGKKVRMVPLPMSVLEKFSDQGLKK